MNSEIKGYNDQHDLHKNSDKFAGLGKLTEFWAASTSSKSCVRHLPPVGLSVCWINVGTTIMWYETSQSNRSPEWRDQLQDLFPARYRLLTCLQDLSQKPRNTKATQLLYMLLWFTFSFMTPFKMSAGVFWSTSSGLHKALVQPLGMVVRSALLRRNSSEYKLPCCILSFSYDKSQKLPLENFTWKINHTGSSWK